MRHSQSIASFNGNSQSGQTTPNCQNTPAEDADLQFKCVHLHVPLQITVQDALNLLQTVHQDAVQI